MSLFCEALVNYRQLVGGEDFGWVMRLPCKADHQTCVVCAKKKPATQEDVDRHEAEVKEMIAQSEVVFDLMDRLKKENKKGTSGTTECPKCKGRLRWSIAGSNGHCHVACQNPECGLTVME
jgi:hypothetical protein